MPILSYFAVVGSVLVALLFVADATMEKSGPLPFNNEAVGLPKPWHAENNRMSDKTAILTAAPAPAPDMTSAAVRAAAPPAPQIAPVAEAPGHAAKAEAVPEQAAKADVAAKKRAVRKPRHDDGWRSYAWSGRNNHDGFFGGGNSTFGRF